MELIDKILVDYKWKKYFTHVFMALSKAFDTLDHNILLNKLQYYGVIGIALVCFTSYLKDRKQLS